MRFLPLFLLSLVPAGAAFIYFKKVKPDSGPALSRYDYGTQNTVSPSPSLFSAEEPGLDLRRPWEAEKKTPGLLIDDYIPAGTEWREPTKTARWQTPLHGQKYEPYFLDASQRYNIPAGVVSRIAAVESNYNPRAESPAGAKGIMQIIPRWHPLLRDPFDPAEAILYGAGYLRENYNRFGSWEKAYAAYNVGPTKLAEIIQQRGVNWKAGLPKETKDYIVKVSSKTHVA